MKAKILAALLLQHPELEVLMIRAGDHKNIKPFVTTALHSDIVDIEEKVVVKQDEDFILLTGVEL